jgi:hypothetical protein
MESPFVSENNTINLYSEPILEPYQQIYLNVLTLSGIPKGPLSKMTKQMKVPKLSPFHPFPNCIYALTRYPNDQKYYSNDFWMLEEDIPSVLSYLQNHNYKIETSMVHHHHHHHHHDHHHPRKPIITFSYSS